MHSENEIICLPVCPFNPSIFHLIHSYLSIKTPIDSSVHLSIHNLSSQSINSSMCAYPFISVFSLFAHPCLLLHVTGCLIIYSSIHLVTHSSLFCLSIHLCIILYKLIICLSSSISIYPSACLFAFSFPSISVSFLSSVCPSFIHCLCVYPYTHRSIQLHLSTSICLSIHLHISPFCSLSIYQSIDLHISVSSPIYLHIYLSIYLSI